MPAGPVRRQGYQGTRIRQLAPDVFADNQPLGSDRLPHLDQPIPTGSITADKLAPGVLTGIDRDPGYNETSGALPTITTFVSGTGKQVDTVSSRFLNVPITITANSGDPTATCLVELSPDNVTYSSIGTVTYPDFGGGATRNGIIFFVSEHIPQSWYIRITVSRMTIGTGTYW